MKILAIETTCDETAFALGEWDQDRLKILGETVLSQIELHKQFGGVVPNLSAREHLANFQPLLLKTLEPSGTKLEEVDAFSVANGPGLIPALLVGVTVAKTLAYAQQKPLVPINHVEGHIMAAWLKGAVTEGLNGKQSPRLPALCLLVSGGHTQLVMVRDFLDYEIVGETLDDAAGEAFDKAARLLGLGYPGGPAISEAALKGDEKSFALPRPMLNTAGLDFSFSGLKTALLYLEREEAEKQGGATPELQANLAAAFEAAVIDVLVGKTKRALKDFRPNSLILGGGVAANVRLRKGIEILAQAEGLPAHIPDLKYCGDNATMQIPAAWLRLEKEGQEFFRDGWKTVTAQADLRLGGRGR